MKKRILSLVIALCLMLSCVSVVDFSTFTTQAAVVDVESTSASTGPQSTIQGSAILHCFNWSYNSIKNNLQAIKNAGYTAVQTSPVQSPKDYNSSWRDQQGQWWKLYQPLDFTISNYTWLGTKSDLKSLCDAAESMGIKVVVDVVANHVANNHEGGGFGNLNGGVASNLRRADYYHDHYDWANDGSRYAMTMGHIGMPDLNTAHGDVQNIVKNFLIECINIGVDGFRFDAAKHIELPNDQGNSSQFWPTVINGSQAATSREIFYYGEILNGCGTDINNYTKYMSITDNYSSDAILVAANNCNASGMANSGYAKGAAADKNVLWVESHDTHMGESGSAGISKTSGISDATIIKAWAMVGSRADATSLFFARPAHNMGDASSNTTWKSPAVTEINKFKNYFDGQPEYLSCDGSIAYNERGTSGVVLVNANGSSASVNVPARKMANGTYKDAISGSTFTVSNGRISGNIGNTGVAVVYNPSNNNTQPTVAPTVPPTIAPTQSNKIKVLYGDVDFDSKISIMDVSSIQKHLSFMKELSKLSLFAGDVDLDGQTNILDASLIQKHLANVPQKSKCGTYVMVDPNNFDDIIDPTEPTPPPVTGDYIYFKNNDNWSTVNMYYWSDSNTGMTSWPGVNMTLHSGNVYRAELPSGAKYVIFNNGQGAQTADLTVPQLNMIYDNGNWNNYGSVSPVIPTDAPTQNNNNNNDNNGTFVYYKNTGNWGEVKAYYWSDSNSNMTSWPGVHMESVGNNVYKVEVPSDATMIIFNNNNQGQQTQDLHLEGFNKIYDNGNWSSYTG